MSASYGFQSTKIDGRAKYKIFQTSCIRYEIFYTSHQSSQSNVEISGTIYKKISVYFSMGWAKECYLNCLCGVYLSYNYVYGLK